MKLIIVFFLQFVAGTTLANNYSEEYEFNANPCLPTAQNILIQYVRGTLGSNLFFRSVHNSAGSTYVACFTSGVNPNIYQFEVNLSRNCTALSRPIGSASNFYCTHLRP